MDPVATLALLKRAVDMGDYAEAVDALTDYYQWRVKGGAEPPSGDSVADMLANRLADKLEEPV